MALEPRLLTRMESALEDRTLMERIKDGNTCALEEMLGRYWLSLVSYADHLVSDPDLAEDVVQQVVVRFWDQRSSWVPSDRLAGFLYQATRHACLNELDKQRVRRRWAKRQRTSATRRPTTPLELAERAELREVLTKAVDALPPRRREVFVLARFHGRSYRDIGDIMHISPQTVANQVSAAVRDLRRRLRPELAKFLPDPDS